MMALCLLLVPFDQGLSAAVVLIVVFSFSTILRKIIISPNLLWWTKYRCPYLKDLGNDDIFMF